VLSGFLGAIAAVTISTSIVPAPPAPESPECARYRQFVRAGRGYRTLLCEAYAAAWDEGARLLESGEPLSHAIDAVSRTWSASRTKLFDVELSPRFSGVIPESTKDDAVTPLQRATMASDWRGLAKGLRTH
jgi:hypothetical protein